LDRFGLSVEVKTPEDAKTRIMVVRRRDDFERDPAAFVDHWKKEDARIRRRIVAARERIAAVTVPDAALERATELCMRLGVDGLRGELTMVRAARALASLDGETVVGDSQLRRVAPSALRHRLRRNPLDEAGSSVRVQRAIDELFAS
jgi:magnesium chelatase subunit I